MSRRTVPRFVDGLLRGRPTRRARPDDIEAQEMTTALELRAAGLTDESPGADFVADLHQRLAGAAGDPDRHPSAPTTGTQDIASRFAARRRQVVLGSGLAAASAAAGLVVGRALTAENPHHEASPSQGLLEPNSGTWHVVAVSADLADGKALAFNVGSIQGFVHRTGGRVEAVSGICTHQGCTLWLDTVQLRCPCHSTSFSLEGMTLTHQLPIAPPPLPKFQVREVGGAIEVFAPAERA